MINVLFIVNPASNGGAGIKAWQTFQSTRPDPIDSSSVVFTEYPGHAREIAAASTAYDILAAVGGDGTVGEVISGIMDSKEPRARLAIIPCGTGNDVARDAGILSVSGAVSVLRKARSRPFDLIKVAKADEYRYAFLFANAGFSAIPMLKPWMKRMLGAKASYYLATLLQVLLFHPPHMTLRIDGRKLEGPVFLVVAGNAEYAGGGSMRIAPGARTDDGELNISVVGKVRTGKVITRLFSSLAKGTHINEPEVSYLTGREIEISSEPPAVLDLDGELFGTAPATISVCPKALHIICSVADQHQKGEAI